MKKLLPLLLLLTAFTASRGQVVNWAFNIPDKPSVSKLTVDPASNLYLYGYSDYYGPHESEGSMLIKYSPDGTLLFRRDWKAEFFISSMINDGKGHFYFCGSFSGRVHEPGISLDSEGGSDGFFGLMDEEGRVTWTIGFGGAKNDMANDLAFNADSSEIVITGGVDSTVILYDYALLTTPPAIFVARFTLQGGLQSYRTYAFTPNEYGSNMGLEIAPNATGGYYLLADRMGDHWSNEATPSGSPMEGRHVFSLDKDLNIDWSRFIISSSCYYGYSCRNMSVQNGRACVPSFCSGKYGGNGHLQKLDETNGQTTWNIDNRDGTYFDTYASGNTLLYVGNEEANGCPCEDNNPGFARVKALDENEQDRILLSKYGFHFYNLTQGVNHQIYVLGYASGPDPHLEGRSLQQGFFLFSMQGPPSTNTITEHKSDLVRAYPNPSSGYVEVVSKDLMDELIIVNSTGTVVRQVSPAAKACTVRDLEPGYYILRGKGANGTSTGRLLVQHN